jgi:leader peptidase (prepilin peptidase)/N-methyltransferase
MPYYVIPDIFFAFVLFIFGTVVGSFLNVVIYRTPEKEQIVKGRSHCINCKHDLAWYDLFPILSWIILLGKCRYCKTPITGRYALVEALTGLLFTAAYLVLGLQLQLAFALVLFPILICASFFDIDTGEIEYWCPVSIGVLGLAALGLSIFGITGTSWHSHLIGAFVISVPFLILALFGAMGGADIQLMAAAGLLLGFNIIPAAFVGMFLGAVAGMIIKLTKSKQAPKNSPDLPQNSPETISSDDSGDGLPQLKGTVIRFGPFLSIGIVAGFLYGEVLIDWYMSFMR